MISATTSILGTIDFPVFCWECSFLFMEIREKTETSHAAYPKLYLYFVFIDRNNDTEYLLYRSYQIKISYYSK